MPPVAATLVGAPGGAAGVMLFEAVEADPVPAEFTALTVNVYAVPLVSPFTVAVVVDPPTEVVTLPGLDTTVYEVMAAPLLEAGATHVTVACAFPAVAFTPVGAPGGPAGITAFDGAEAGPLPTEFAAVTVKV